MNDEKSVRDNNWNYRKTENIETVFYTINLHNYTVNGNNWTVCGCVRDGINIIILMDHLMSS